MHDFAGAFALAVQISLVDDVEFAPPFIPCGVVKFEFKRRYPRQRCAPIMFKLLLVSQYRTTDKIACHRADELCGILRLRRACAVRYLLSRMRAQAWIASLRPRAIFTLSRARISEGVAIHSLLTGYFCRTAGAVIFGLLLGLTRRQSFRFGHMPLRPGHTYGHGSCKQCYSECFQHGCFLPGLVH